MVAHDIRLTIQPLNEEGQPEGDDSEITYPIPEDQYELEDLCGYLRNDLQAALEDYLPKS